MNTFTYWFCCRVMWLNRIPRYGRIYTWSKPGGGYYEIGEMPMRWVYQKHGHWGMNLLNNMGLLWRYIDESQKRHQEKPE